ncbi:MAG: GspE/PulE family protein [Candidatus Moranbacteria bacterium]|jgi:type IV pilus assembly protein PilB|nr:GspE/PulE family protein [Candidatus Moranbacteria bacterium]MDX9855391.1 GspE/PulE family protein [Candidatus Moranbacteria bacterium]
MPEKKIKKNEKREELKELAEELGVGFLEKAPESVDRKTVKIIPEEVGKKYGMVSFAREGKNIVKVVMSDPQNVEARNILGFLAERNKVEFDVSIAPPDVIKEILGKYHSAEKAVEDVMLSFQDSVKEREEASKKRKKVDSNIIIQDAPVSKLVKVIINHAIEGEASDIHIEPIDNEYRVRYRVDGMLHSTLVLPKSVGMAAISHIKILSNLKIDETRKPQDGRFKANDENIITSEGVDFRVSTLPVIEGEKVAMRVLTKDDRVFDLKKLGLMGKNFDVLNKKIKEPNGIILNTGPTGSGKSTTLYSFLRIINKEERNIVTLEDPIEYSLEGINQSQINPAIGYTFASGLRSILRQDPNVIMIGEIRDNETAELAIHASLTGHLVFSTLHTNNAISAIPRLIDMGIEPFLLSSSLSAVAAQRLVRRLCDNCKKEIKLPEKVYATAREALETIDNEELKKYDIDGPLDLDNLKFYTKTGCEECGNTGYKGRLAIFECVDVDNDLKEVITEKNEILLKKVAQKQNMLTMRQDGFLKAAKGLTSVSEVERMTEGTMSVGELEDDIG